MWTTVKKIVLFLFGIVLVVFGNKAAINTIFNSEDKADDNTTAANDADVKEPVITEDVEVEAPEEKPQAEVPAVTPKEQKTVTEKKEPKVAEQPKTSKAEEPKVDAPVKQEEKVQEQPAKEQVKEAPKTTIEPEQSESASGSE